ncbi:hypothetical protein [Arthrobacter sp. TWP1-1]|uniref:hypothetical protein n=1 Tax=Arthrobacter sp. TWP1-1 TaxID=2804568 RepID=UPI003CF3AA52
MGHGTKNWGNVAVAHDIALWRAIASTLLLDDTLNCRRTATSNCTYSSRVTGESELRWPMNSDGSQSWGNGTTPSILS